jgi:hypothetical protein
VATSGTLQLSLEQAIARGLQYNLGLIDDQEANADARAQREHALAALLPQISARAEQAYQQLSFKSINVTLPPQTGLKLPPTSGQFGYSEARFTASSPLVNISLLDGYRQQKGLEDASALETKDARDVVVFVVGAAYFQVVASEAQLRTAQAELASARELDSQVADQYRSEVSPEIDTLRADVELHTAEQRVANATNQLEKDKLTLDRVTGIPLDQSWAPDGDYNYHESHTGDISITAEFKETQLGHMHPGQPVTIHVDTFGRDFRGTVEDMPGASGPLFSLFPPENASGNYAKIVQRFPVRIHINPGEDPQHQLRPGMSVEAKVRVR